MKKKFPMRIISLLICTLLFSLSISQVVMADELRGSSNDGLLSKFKAHVTYNGNCNNSGVVPNDSNEYIPFAIIHGMVKVQGNTGNLQKTGYYFGGWNTNAVGTGKNYMAGDKFIILRNTTLYANWISLSKDKTPPVITITSPNGSESYKTTDKVTLKFDAQDSQSGIESVVAKLNGTKVENGQVIDLALMGGTNKLNVVAIDKAGNKAEKEVSFDVTIISKVSMQSVVICNSKTDVLPFFAEIELPSGYNVSEIKRDSVNLQVNGTVINAESKSLVIKDKNKLVVYFDRAKVNSALNNVIGEINFTVKGKLNNGANFQGSQYVKVASVEN